MQVALLIPAAARRPLTAKTTVHRSQIARRKAMWARAFYAKIMTQSPPKRPRTLASPAGIKRTSVHTTTNRGRRATKVYKTS